jgi:hypothetical protein
MKKVTLDPHGTDFEPTKCTFELPGLKARDSGPHTNGLRTYRDDAFVYFRFGAMCYGRIGSGEGLRTLHSGYQRLGFGLAGSALGPAVWTQTAVFGGVPPCMYRLRIC